MARSEHGRGTAWAWTVYVKQTRLNCANQMGKTQSEPLATRNGRGTAGARHGHGMGTAWARHGMCELAFRKPWLLQKATGHSPLVNYSVELQFFVTEKEVIIPELH
jgi:hypothetical protein